MVRTMRVDDVAPVARLHVACFPGFFLTSLGPRFLKLYYRNVLQASTGVALVIDEGGSVQGFVVGVMNPSAFYAKLLREQWLAFGLAALPAFLLRPWIARRLLGAFHAPKGRPQGVDTAELASVAVSPGCTGKGFGQVLVRGFIAEMQTRGCRRIILGARATDERNHRFYLGLGFRPVHSVEGAGGTVIEYEMDLASDVSGAGDGMAAPNDVTT